MTITKSDLILIACHASEQSESKKHGGYQIFEDEKIRIAYDTYYPNLYVSVFIDGNKITVASFSGHGHTAIYKHGAWEKYAESLIPLATTNKQKKHESAMAHEKEIRKSKFGAIDDSKVFA